MGEERRDARTIQHRRGGPLRVVQEAVTLARETMARARPSRAPADAILYDQLVRAVVSVYANIVEGNARPSRRDTRRFLGIAWASLREYETHLEVALATGLLAPADADVLRRRARWVGRLLSGLRRHYAGD